MCLLVAGILQLLYSEEKNDGLDLIAVTPRLIRYEFGAQTLEAIVRTWGEKATPSHTRTWGEKTIQRD